MKMQLTPAQKVARADRNPVAQALRKADEKLVWLAQQIHELPDKAIVWCRALPARWEAFKPIALAWMDKHGVTARVKVFAPIAAAALVVPFCMMELEFAQTTYVLQGNGEPQVIQGYPHFSMENEFLSINTDDSGHDAQMILNEGQKVLLTHNGETVTVTARAETVANLLRRKDAECNKREMAVLDFTGEQLHITVTEEYTYERTVEAITSFVEERIPDPLMEKGQEEILAPGQTGLVYQTYHHTYRDGQMVSTKLVDTQTVEAQTRQVRYGTRVQEVSRDDRIESVHYNDDGSGYLLFQSGDTMTFSSQVTCNATAYSIGSWTASGLPTKVGHIAVDPTVFPYHTRFYIYTNDGYLVYGNAVAADCGTSIKGYKIDLWFETFDEACWFGRRDCTVFVLN